MELVFEKVGNHYVAEFKADNDFNLHVERTKLGTLEVYQKGVEEGEYDFAWSIGIGARKVIDYDFAALVYPKWIKVVSGSEVVSASVNFNEGGGSGSGSGEASTIEYLDVSEMTDEMSNKKLSLIFLSYLTKYVNNNIVTISGGASLLVVANNNDSLLNGVVAIAIDFNAKIVIEGNTFNTILEYLSDSFSQEELDSIPRITKEEFYNLDISNTQV